MQILKSSVAFQNLKVQPNSTMSPWKDKFVLTGLSDKKINKAA